ncbi:MAG: PulJ/GspJ family protein [Planctomycetota bacterium]|jgi:prepilin-type N-terminal cleavage/methylation domain-containing protein
MKKSFNTSREPRGFSLAEVLAALTIGAMVLIAVLGIYSRAGSSAAAITRKLDNLRLPSEVLQRIAEDLDRIIASGSDTKITIENKLNNLYPTARLTIRKNYFDKERKPQVFEEIIWQTSYDYDTDSLILYRSHSGLGLEDKLLDEQRQDLEKGYPFVPICTGVTYFKIQVLRGENLVDRWSGSPPQGVVVTISFAEPFKTVAGDLDVLEEEKITRTIAIDRTRKIRFIFVKKEDEGDMGEDEEVMSEDEEVKSKDEEVKSEDRARRARVEEGKNSE